MFQCFIFLEIQEFIIFEIFVSLITTILQNTFDLVHFYSYLSNYMDEYILLLFE